MATGHNFDLRVATDQTAAIDIILELVGDIQQSRDIDDRLASILYGELTAEL